MLIDADGAVRLIGRCQKYDGRVIHESRSYKSSVNNSIGRNVFIEHNGTIAIYPNAKDSAREVF
jgi:hypothetical protein